jgi:hypothetical protein
VPSSHFMIHNPTRSFLNILVKGCATWQVLTLYLFDRHTDDVRLFADSCLNKNLKLRAECKGLLVQQFVTKWEVLTPNYLTRWLNGSTKKKSVVSADPNVSVEEGNASPIRSPEPIR